MPDEWRLARLEERVEALVKRLERNEDIVEKQIDAVQRAIRESITDQLERIEESIRARAEAFESRYKIVQLVVFGLVGGVLIAFLNFLIGGWTGPGSHPFKGPAPSYRPADELKDQPAWPGDTNDARGSGRTRGQR